MPTQPTQQSAQLVEITEIHLDLQYTSKQYPGTLTRSYLRVEAKNRLLKANTLAQERYDAELVLWDAYRTSLCQGYLVHEFFNRLHTSDTNHADCLNETLRFVAWPDEQAAHKSGGTVDVSLVDADGTPLPMGGEFDELTDRSISTYYERDDVSADEIMFRDNRRKLHDVMTAAGFVNYPEEWWHYEYGTNRWANTTGKPMLFSAISFAE